MPDKLKYILLLLICALGETALAQSQGNPNYPNNNPNNPNYPNQRLNTRDTGTAKSLYRRPAIRFTPKKNR